MKKHKCIVIIKPSLKKIIIKPKFERWDDIDSNIGSSSLPICR